ncbi:transglycosylase SLT domain-containing protein [Brucella pseudogrignonensis]|jgi:soluble lytic murein transglycosylase-like protein|uniref:lytic transglycosylase domain-containing protein n=1 Tax=Brucella/Ochrobactrum group TaxID=2826938 RepID=UPI000DDB5A8F|nr:MULTISPECIES: lytic transglycosylase domain-containing protein [Brucella]KAB2692065.1 lytic transglycosylase domain-containing protein [Brucella pseudogrignonensis]QWK76961.1 lytic transglycosylase domain-containing protein [Ochrobactrum sp. BTU1]
MKRSHLAIATVAVFQLLCWPEAINSAFAENGSEAEIYGPPMPPKKAEPTVARICELIEASAENRGIPKDFFARLIWKESRFDHRAVSPVGAQGIAQFMPYTAKERGLADPFDIEQAIPASASFLSELKGAFGNWGLAAAAYNAGPTRVSNWMRSGGFLPLETEDYVLDLTGAPADNFASGNEITNRPLDAKLTFTEACKRLPIVRTATIPMSQIKPKPWGIQVAGNFRRSVAVNQWSRLRKQFSSVLAGHNPVISRVRTPMARRGIYAVRIGADSRSEADNICSKLRAVGGACIVLRNR